jgi:hypothetical protein
MIRFTLIPLIATATVGTSCFDLVDIEVRASEVCLTGVVIEVPGAAPGAVEILHVQEDPALELPIELDTRAELMGVGITAIDGVDDFGFVHTARIALSADGLDPITVVDIGEAQRGALAGSDRWFLAAGADVDLIDYFLAPELAFELAFEGEMPAHDWAVAIDVCVAGTARYAAGL